MTHPPNQWGCIKCERSGKALENDVKKRVEITIST